MKKGGFMGNFIRDLKFAESGENVVYNYLKKLNCTLDVLDVRYLKYFQDADIDFIHVMNNCLQPNFIEVKTDRMAHRTGNLPYEVISNYKCNSVGCFEKTLATHIFFYLSQTKQLYVLDVFKLKEYVKNNESKLKLINMGDNAKGYLLKIVELIKLGICTDLGIINTQLNKEGINEV